MDSKLKQLKFFANALAGIHQYSEDVYWIAQLGFKRAEYISPSLERNWGYPCEEMLKNSKAWDACVLPVDLKHYHPFLEMNKKISQEGPQARFNETYRIVRPDGRIRWILDRGHPIYNARDECIGITGVAIDITVNKIYHQFPLQSWEEFPHADQSRYYLGGPYKNIYLTLSEAKCAFYLLQGKTAKQTSRILNLSYRTVEVMLYKIKKKFGLSYRSDVCEALIEGDFIYSLNSGI